MSNRTPSTVEKYYLMYEHLASNYASKIFNYERQGYEYQDILQELKIKIYSSIVAYAKKWMEYKRTGRYKPVPIEYYIKNALVNRQKDYIKQFNYETVENSDKISIQRNSFDYSVYTENNSEIDLGKCICVINGIDLFEGLEDDAKRCFALYIKGFSIPKLKTMFKRKFNSESVIQNQIHYLSSFRKELMDFDTKRHTLYAFEEE